MVGDEGVVFGFELIGFLLELLKFLGSFGERVLEEVVLGSGNLVLNHNIDVSE